MEASKGMINAFGLRDGLQRHKTSLRARCRASALIPPFPPVSKQKCALLGAFLFVSTIQPTNHQCHWPGLGWTSSDTLQSFVPLSCGIALDDVVHRPYTEKAIRFFYHRRSSGRHLLAFIPPSLFKQGVKPSFADPRGASNWLPLTEFE